MNVYLSLPHEEQLSLLTAVSHTSGLSIQAIEKDIWLCWALNELFTVKGPVQLAFKGGTSLSKVFGAIHRFSEDVDVTLNYSDLIPDPGIDLFDPDTSKGAIRRYSDSLRTALRAHVHEFIVPPLTASLSAVAGQRGKVTLNEECDLLLLTYPSAVSPRPEIKSSAVLIEFGGRNTTLPNGPYRVEPMASFHLPDWVFPCAEVTTLAPERTFWEKATLIHVECNRGRLTCPNRISRHWYDLYMLGKSDIGRRAMEDRALLEDVVRIKSVFFNASYAHYDQCLRNEFKIVPHGSLAAQLESDYRAMIAAGMFMGEPPEFWEITDGLTLLEREINRR